MNIRYGHCSLARAMAGVSLAASILGSAGFASAATCDFAFPHEFLTCTQGNSSASVAHRRSGNPLRFSLTVDMVGGTLGAVAYGIDTNGTHLSVCDKSAADDDPRFAVTRAVSCLQLYNTSGTAPSSQAYDHPDDISLTHIVVI